MLNELDSYDWEQAFMFADKPQPTMGFTGSRSAFTREDVAVVLGKQEGCNDEESWIGAFLLKDDRFAYLEAWCDYTGWDCQAGGSSWVAGSFDQLWNLGMTQPARDRLEDAMISYLAGIV